MPTYDYQCLKCGSNFEAFQKMSDEALKSCPQCQGKVKRLVSSGSGIIFKGKGFYATDYKKSNEPRVKKEEVTPCAGCDQSGCKQKNKE